MDQITAFICITFDKSTKVIDVKTTQQYTNKQTQQHILPELNVAQGLYVSKHHMIYKNTQKFCLHASIEINLN
jgi:hypothetical protein